MSSHNFLAIDLGAESGRVILGTLNNMKLSLKDIHRFPNGMLKLGNNYYWNIGQLYKEIIKGLEICIQQEKVQPESIGIDTWGVDYGLLGKDGTLLGLPFAYRDSRTENAIEEFNKIIPLEKLYKLTGTLLAPYNTVFQLFAASKKQSEVLNIATDLLFMPDLLAYLLTGEKKTEFSFATTSQLYNPAKKEWESSLFETLGISKSMMQEVINPGDIIGFLDDEICKDTGMNKIPVIAVATHDTNSAIAAIPATGDNWAFISSGTWSLMGFENSSAIISDDSYKMNFTNEGGIGGTYNILKNHCGFWILQQCRRSWKSENYDYSKLNELSQKAKPFTAFIDIDDPSFHNPEDMPTAITNYLAKTGQIQPSSHGQIVRIILESLALKYRKTFEEIKLLSGRQMDRIFITGGGVNNQLLCQLTANATGAEVFTALAEGTAAGNIMAQALGMGYVKSLAEIRQVIANSCEIKHYQPCETEKWDIISKK